MFSLHLVVETFGLKVLGMTDRPAGVNKEKTFSRQNGNYNRYRRCRYRQCNASSKTKDEDTSTVVDSPLVGLTPLKRGGYNHLPNPSRIEERRAQDAYWNGVVVDCCFFPRRVFPPIGYLLQP